MLTGVSVAPDLDLFRYLGAETPGLGEELYNRYAHVLGQPPQANAVLLGDDAFTVPMSPCSRRLATLGVNHFVGNPGISALPPACTEAWEQRRAGDLVLWSRRVPVSPVGVATKEGPLGALDFDFDGRLSGAGPRLERHRNGVSIVVPEHWTRPVAFAVNRSLVESVRCRGARAAAFDAHVAVWPERTGGRCDFEFLGSWGALRRLWDGARASRASAPTVLQAAELAIVEPAPSRIHNDVGTW